MPGEDRVLPAFEKILHLEPAVLVESLEVPKRVVEKEEGPPDLAVFGQFSLQPFTLLGTDTHLLVSVISGGVILILVAGVQANKKTVLVNKTEIATAVGFLPDVRLHLQVGVVVAGNVEEGHLQLLDIAVELGPLLLVLVLLGRSLDEVAHRHDKLGLQQVDLLDGSGEHPGAVATGAVGNDGKLELVGCDVGLQAGPGILVLHFRHKARLGVSLQGAARIGNTPGKPERDPQARGHTHQQKTASHCSHPRFYRTVSVLYSMTSHHVSSRGRRFHKNFSITSPVGASRSRFAYSGSRVPKGLQPGHSP